MFMGSAISWASKQQRTVATSMAQSKYCVMSDCVREASGLSLHLESVYEIVRLRSSIQWCSEVSIIGFLDLPTTEHFFVIALPQ